MFACRKYLNISNQEQNASYEIYRLSFAALDLLIFLVKLFLLCFF